jgi:hypothetical protein
MMQGSGEVESYPRGHSTSEESFQNSHLTWVLVLLLLSNMWAMLVYHSLNNSKKACESKEGLKAM